ncbi:MAG: hypothetical protein ACR2NO_04745 [Chloroflexota bacterium]
MVLKWTWITLAVAVLLLTLFFFDGRANSDADTVLAYGMLTLSFPIGLFIALIAGGVGYVAHSAFGYVVPVSYWSIVIGWILFAVGGYWQWFVLAPTLWRKLRAPHRTTDRSGTGLAK